MFPFLNGNGYIGPPIPYNMNYDSYRSPQMRLNPYFYSFINPNLQFQHETSVPMQLSQACMPYFLERSHHLAPRMNPSLNKKKRITKKLSLIKIKKKMRGLNSGFNIIRKSFKYFDPSRAPPLTSLRNSQELQLDLKYQSQTRGSDLSNISHPNEKLQESQRKLQILLKQPNALFYPFLICKKRKYHRNLKRRYSVAYFQQRATYIINKEPIPTSLHPKNKVRKPRLSKNNTNEVSQSLNDYIQSSFSSNQEESNGMMNLMKVKN